MKHLRLALTTASPLNHRSNLVNLNKSAASTSRTLYATALLGLSALSGGYAQAGLLFSQLPADGGTPLGAYTGGFNPQQVAEDFQLQQDAAVADFHWWGVQGNSLPNDFRLTFYNDTGSGAPQVAPFATVDIGDVSGTDTGLDSNLGTSILKYDAVFAPLSLSAGTTYWLSITNQISATDANDGWYWITSVEGDSSFYFDNGSGWTFTNFTPGMAFQVTGVPAPASAALFGIGLAALGVARRRRLSLTSRSPS